MADKKISELNSAAAVYDADDFALVQDGDTKQVNASAVKAYVKDGLIKSDVGLGNVDNTSDATKPISTATQTALDLKQDAASAATLTGTQTLTNKTLTSPVISGGTANNVAIGGATPAAGAFTTLSSTGNTTLGDASADTLTINAGTTTFAQGTANGVLYLNGSKVATSGSGLVFDGTNLGVGLVNPAAYLGRFGIDGNIAQASGGYHYFWDAANTFGWYIRNASNALALGQYAGSEIARFTSKGLLVGYTSDSGLSGTGNAIFSGSVGIGTSSPGERLNVVGGGATSSTLNVTGGNNNDNSTIASDYSLIFQVDANNNVGGRDFTWRYGGKGYSDGTMLMTLNSYGNLGLGVTPSAWSGFKVLETINGSLLSDSSSLRLINNGYYNGSNWIYSASSYASRYDVKSGGHYWYTAPPGTAGAAFTFTQAMTLDASGNLLIGKTNSSVTTVGMQIYPSGGLTSTLAGATNATSTLEVYSTGAANYRFYVGMNGTVNATNTTIAAISDQRLKENIQDLDIGLNAILALKPRKFDWKAGKGKDIKGDRGFIAQEFEQVFPDLIDTWKDEPPAGEEPYKSVRQDLIPVLVKAVQELHAEIETLKAKVN